MIDIKEKKDCVGCEACIQRCPKHCIFLLQDIEGFFYPKVNTNLCIQCGLCEKVCPVIHQAQPRKPIQVFAAKNPNENIRLKSSSGGIFTLLAEQIIDKGGVVFGAKFDKNWDVIHSYTETKEGLVAFRGSKYVQSKIGTSFQDTERFLRNGRDVLFSGTPCQIRGLKLFLGKDYEKLITVDFICHGVPSPGIWKKYLEEETAHQYRSKNAGFPHIINNKGDIHIVDIQFRDKRIGWKNYSFSVLFSATKKKGEQNTILFTEPLDKNIYMKGFLNNLFLRPSCYACPAKSGKSYSDITIGDFWGIQHVLPEMDDDKGISIIFLQKPKVKELLKTISLKEIHYNTVIAYNPSIESSVRLTKKRTEFFKGISRKSFYRIIYDLTKISNLQKCRYFLGIIYSKIFS